jgi:hypothetical protein
MAAGREVYRGRHVIVSFQMDRSGIAQIAMGPKLLAAVLDLAETKAKPYAESISPRSDRDDHVHYADSFVVVPGTAWIAAMRRVAARLYNTAPHAAAVEWGNAGVNARGHRVLGRTLDHLNSFGHDHN